MKVTIKPALDENKSHYMRKWYGIKLGANRTLLFHSSAFVPEDVQDQLNEVHETAIDYDALSERCFEILKPYLASVAKAAVAYLKENPKKAKPSGFSFDPPKIKEQ